MKHPVCTPWEAHHAYWGIIIVMISLLLSIFTLKTLPIIIISIVSIVLMFIWFTGIFYKTNHILDFVWMFLIYLVLSIYLYSTNVWYMLLNLTGWLIYLDDFIQHTVQWKNPDYHSPLHVFVYRVLKINKIQWIKDFTNWIDKLFGKKGA